MNDQGIIRWASLRGENPRDGIRVQRIGTESVHRLGREGDQPPATQDVTSTPHDFGVWPFRVDREVAHLFIRHVVVM